MKTPNPDDLLVAARRRALSASEQRQFQMLVDASPESELLFGAGKGFDEEGEPLPGDKALVNRLVARTVKARRERSRGRPLRALLLASVISGAASAAAGIAIVTLPARRAPDQVAPAAASAPVHPAASRRNLTANSAVAPSASAVENVEAPTAEVSLAAASDLSSSNATTAKCESPRPRVSPVATVSPTESGATAAAAYADANALRRGRRTEEAIGAYGQLLARHPGTLEAQQSAIALGNLLLESGRYTQALAAFATYRKGPLDEEAAWGQIRALLALGRISEARETLALLETAHPSSPYVVAAHRRLSRQNESGASTAPTTLSP